MPYIEKIAYHLGERSEVPNQQLAKELAEKRDAEGIDEIASYLHDKNQSVASDCLKVLYEIGYIDANLIAGYTDVFAALLQSKNNRMVWGGMIALADLAVVVPEKVYAHKALILAGIETGTVITHVHGVRTIINLAKSDAYYDELKSTLFELQRNCRPVDFAKRAELMIEAVREADMAEYIDMLEERLPTLSNAAQKRLGRLIRKHI